MHHVENQQPQALQILQAKLCINGLMHTPTERIKRLTIAAQFVIKAVAFVAAAVADRCDGVARIDLFAHML